MISSNGRHQIYIVMWDLGVQSVCTCVCSFAGAAKTYGLSPITIAFVQLLTSALYTPAQHFIAVEMPSMTLALTKCHV